MGKDEEVPGHFGMLHGKTLTPHRSIWTLAILSAVIGIVTVAVYLGGTTPAPLDPKYHNFWYSFGIFSDPATLRQAAEHAGHRHAGEQLRDVPALHAHLHHRHRGLPRAPQFNGFKHMFVPLFGLVANLICMLFYLVGPFAVRA